MDDDDEDRIIHICQKLIPPIVLSSPGRWRLVEDEESLITNNQGKTAKERVDFNAKVVVDWVEEEAPRLLKRLLTAIEGGSVEQLSLRTRGLIAIASSRFISPRKQSHSSREFSINQWTNEERYLFTSHTNERLARSILSQMSKDCKEDNIVLSSDLLELMLQTYIRPLFSLTNSASINVESGRARQDSKIRRAGGGLMEDDTIWKGGDIKHASGMQLMEQSVVNVDQSNPTPIQARHAGIASELVFYICCKSIQSMSDDKDGWNQYWTQILPPLLQLLEDPSPRFRLTGTQILIDCLLAGHKESKQRQKIGTLLLRTGVGQLIFSNLTSSLTFISNRVSGPLLQSTSEAWIKLTNVMTVDIIKDIDKPQNYLQDDGGRGRYERLSQLMDEGVLRVWAYAPSHSTSFDEDQFFGMSNDVPEDCEALECMDIIDASIGTLIALSHTEALGIGIVRYLDVTLEFLISQLLGMEKKAERAKQRGKQSVQKSSPVMNLQREILSAKAIYSILDISRSCPVIENWSTRCITVCARCWVIMKEANIQNTSSSQLPTKLDDIVTVFVETFPQKSKEVLHSINYLDPSQFASFTAPHLKQIST